MSHKKIIGLLLIVSGTLLFSFTQSDISNRNIEKIRNIFSIYIDSIHPQKVYLHTDKSHYFSGEHIFFRVYLFNGITHLPEFKSQHVYVELVDPYKRSVQSIRVRNNDRDMTGDFMLSDTIPEGIYQIRAYTHWMKNFDSQFHFSQNIEVRNANQKFLITEKEVKENKKVLLNKTDLKNKYTIGFFPEGGDVLADIPTRIAFKAENEFGEGISAEGKVTNSKKKVVARFKTEHNGMGAFSLKARADEKYTAQVQFKNGQKENVILPGAVENAVRISIANEFENIRVVLKSNKALSNDRSANEFVLIGHVRGKIYHTSSLNIIDKDTLIRIEKNIFPSGIAHFTLFNNRLSPISERLFFINHNDFLDFRIEGETRTDTLRLSLKPVYSLNSNFFSGSVSVLLCDSSLCNIPADNIISDMLLTSDLPGYIPDPLYYFDTNNPLAQHHTDLLMLTHGWQRYLWTDIIERRYPDINYIFENGITIQGKITRDMIEFPLKDASVRLFIQNKYNDDFETYSAKNGYFKFEKLNYYDTIDAKIVARHRGDRKNLLIHLEEDYYDEVVKYNGDFFLTTISEIDKKKYRKQQYIIAQEEYDKRKKKLDSIYSQSIYGQPDFVLWGDDIPPGYPNILEAMKGRVPGMAITDDQIIIRGVGSLYGNTDPLILVEGVPARIDILQMIPVEDVERIEVIKGPNSSMYGSRGGNGVIAVYTKRGMQMKRGEISFSMPGYHKALIFHSPSSDRIQRKISRKQLPITIYWNPKIQIYGTEMVFSVPLENTDNDIVIILEGTDRHGKMGSAFARIRN